MENEKYIVPVMENYKLMKMIDNIHEVMDYFDDGYHNEEILQLTRMSNSLVAKLKKNES